MSGVDPIGLRAGTRIGGRYEIIDVIGFGGMGVVYRVREQVGAVSRVRALKTILPNYATNPSIVARFRQEAEKMCLLEHETIVPVLDYSEEGELPYIVMPLVEGMTLKEYLAKHREEHDGPLPIAEVMEIGLEIVRGLEIAHHFMNPSTGTLSPIIHRDIKPGNIMVSVEERGSDRRLRIHIMDLGIAKLATGEDSGQTHTDVIGTVRYAAPEQVKQQKDIDPRADIYSLGMVLYELYVGQHVFHGTPEHGVLMRLMQKNVEETEPDFPEGTSEAFRELIRRAIAVDRDKRFQDVAEMRPLMQRILDEQMVGVVAESQAGHDAALAARQAAAAAGAEKLAAAAWTEARKVFETAERALGSLQYRGAVPLFRTAAIAFERAERLAREKADAEIAHERHEVEGALAEVERELGEEVAAREAVPASLQPLAGADEIEAARRALEAARKLSKKGDLDAVRERLGEARPVLEQARELRDAQLAETAREARARAVERLATVETGDDPTIAAKLHEEVRALLVEGEKALEGGRSGDALARFDRVIVEAERLEQEIERRREERERIRREGKERVARAREEAAADREAARRVEGDEAARPLLERAETLRARAEEAASSESWTRAVEVFQQARDAWREAIRKAEERRRNEYEGQARRAKELLREIGKLGKGDPALAEPRRALDEAEKLAGSGDLERAIAVAAEALPVLEAGLHEAREQAERERARAQALKSKSSFEELHQKGDALGDRFRRDPEVGKAAASYDKGNEQLETGDFQAADAWFRSAAETLVAAEARVRRLLLEQRLETMAATLRDAPSSWSLRRARRAAEKSLERAWALFRVDDGGAPDAVEEAEQLFAAFRERADAAVAKERDQERAAEEKKRAAEAARAERERKAEETKRAAAAALAKKQAAEAGKRERAKPAADRKTAAEKKAPVRRRETPERENEAATQVVDPQWAIGTATPPEEATQLVRQAPTAWAPPEARGKRSAVPWGRIAAGVIGMAGVGLAGVWVMSGSSTTTTGEPDAQPTSIPLGTGSTTAGATAPGRELLTLASASPPEGVISVPVGKTQRFTASVENASEDDLRWELDGVGVGSGSSFTLDTDRSDEPGRVRLALVSARDSATLGSWQIEIQPPSATPVPTTPPIALASTDPDVGALSIPLGESRRFTASVRNASDDDLRWELDGVGVGRGSSFTLGVDRTDEPGNLRLALVATRDGDRRALGTWQIEIPAPAVPTERPREPATLASASPSVGSVSLRQGESRRFTASVRNAGPDDLRWELEGVGVGRGTTFTLGANRTDRPGRLRLALVSTGEGDRRTLGTWQVEIARAVVPTQPPAVDPRAEISRWIVSYCQAFQNNDTGKLLELGHLSNQAEADRLREALSVMKGLRVTCTNESIEVNGGRAVVSFDRTDRWMDPSGRETERTLPRITKTLERQGEGWVVAR